MYNLNTMTNEELLNLKENIDTLIQERENDFRRSRVEKLVEALRKFISYDYRDVYLTNDLDEIYFLNHISFLRLVDSNKVYNLNEIED